jgi:N-methylhydantoinase B
VGLDGNESALEPISQEVFRPGELLGHLLSGGGGYGDPLSREPELVREDVLAGFVTPERARSVYGVAFRGDRRDDSLEIEEQETARLRGGSDG